MNDKVSIDDLEDLNDHVEESSPAKVVLENSPDLSHIIFEKTCELSKTESSEDSDPGLELVEVLSGDGQDL